MGMNLLNKRTTHNNNGDRLRDFCNVGCAIYQTNLRDLSDAGLFGEWFPVQSNHGIFAGAHSCN
jgi:hypothetical protein